MIPYWLIFLSFDVDDPSHSHIHIFNNLTLKIQGQGHGWCELWKSQHGSNILSTHNPKSFHVNWPSHSRYDFFKSWPWKSKVKVMGEANVESYNIGPTFYLLTSLSFHVNQPSHSWDRTFSKFDLENPRSRSWLRSKLKVTMWVWHPIDSHSFRPTSIDPTIPEKQNFLNLTLKIQGEGEMKMMLHNYRSRQFHITSNGINTSTGFRDMASIKSGPSAASFDKFWAMGKAIWGNGQMTMTVHNYWPRQFHKTLNVARPSAAMVLTK